MGDVLCKACGGPVEGDRCMGCKRAYQRERARKRETFGMTFSSAEVAAMDQLVRSIERGEIPDGLLRSPAFLGVAGKFARAKRRREGGGHG